MKQEDPPSQGIPPTERIGSYRLVAQLGQGGMGMVYKARHEVIGQLAAVKILRPGLNQSPAHRARFLAEARAASIVRHPGLVQIFDVGEADGLAYLLMEFLEGQSLRDRLLRRGRLDVASALRITRQVASALHAAHGRGVLHRDIKPDNVLLIGDPEAPGGERSKVLDFGIAKILGQADPRTSAGAILGTVTYMSPEQCMAEPELCGRTDVYSLGVTLYEMLAGQPPFHGEASEVLRQHVFQPPPELRRAAPEVPDDVAALVGRMLAKEPAERPDMAEVEEAIRVLELSVTVESGRTPAARAPGRRTRLGLLPGRGVGLPSGRSIGLPSGRSIGLLIGRSIGLVLGASALLLLLRLATRPQAPLPRAVVSTATIGLAPAPPPGMIYLAGGTFTMGSTPEQVQHGFDACRMMLQLPCDLYQREQPARRVRLSPFFLDRTEVTNEPVAAWLKGLPGLRVTEHRQVWAGGTLLLDLHPDYAGLAEGPAGVVTPRPGHERRPVVQVTWDAARRYCRDHGGDLPSEAQWEFAARGAVGRPFPWGDDAPRCDGVVFGRKIGLGCADLPAGPQEVGSAAQDRTPEGVLDLGGNVGEWVRDRLRVPYPLCDGGECVNPVQDEPAGQAATERVFRGNSFADLADLSRTTRRSRWPQGAMTTNLGFRCARPAR